MRQKAIFILLLFWLPFIKITSQDIPLKNNLYFEGFYHYGFVTPQHSYMAYFVKEHVQSFQLNVGIYASGEKLWHKYYNYPSFGIGLHQSSLSNNDIYGRLSAIYFFADRYFLDNNYIFNFGNRISIGAGYVNKHFNLYSNPFNMAISTSLNIYINYSLETDIRLFPQTNLKVGLGVTHISNGNIKEPNKGINFITSFVGLKYSLSNQKNIRKSYQYIETDSAKKQFFVNGSFGLKNNSRFTNSTYYVYAISIEYSRKIFRTGWLGLVLSNYYDSSLKQELETNDPAYIYKSTDQIRVALNLSYEMKMGNLSYLFQPGFYIKNKSTHSKDMSNRMGVRYYFKNGLTANFLVKAHWFAIADIVEVGLGYNIFK